MVPLSEQLERGVWKRFEDSVLPCKAVMLLQLLRLIFTAYIHVREVASCCTDCMRSKNEAEWIRARLCCILTSPNSACARIVCDTLPPSSFNSCPPIIIGVSLHTFDVPVLYHRRTSIAFEYSSAAVYAPGAIPLLFDPLVNKLLNCHLACLPR